MKTLKMTFLGLCTLAFFIIPIDALAGWSNVRLRVVIQIPQIGVNVYSSGWRGTHSSSYGSYRREIHRVTKWDRRVAGKLSRYTGISRHSLLEYRSRGYTWVEIGRWLDVPRKLLRKALKNNRDVRCAVPPRRHSTRTIIIR